MAVTVTGGAGGGWWEHNHLCGDTVNKSSGEHRDETQEAKNTSKSMEGKVVECRTASWETEYLVEVRDQRSGGCEVAAGSGSLPQIVADLAPGFGPGLPEEESDVRVLESETQETQETHTISERQQHPGLFTSDFHQLGVPGDFL